MALEDIAEFRAVHGSTVLYPSDANQAAKLVAAMADLEGISFLRTTRANTPVIYGPDEEFPVGGSRVVRSSDDDEVTIVGAGITLHEALKAADALAEEGVSARVIDLYSVKPIDEDGLRAAAEATGGRVVTVEDHWPEGGLGEAVLSALAEFEGSLHFTKLAVARDADVGQAGRAARRGWHRRRGDRRGRARARPGASAGVALLYRDSPCKGNPRPRAFLTGTVPVKTARGQGSSERQWFDRCYASRSDCGSNETSPIDRAVSTANAHASSSAAFLTKPK